MAKKKKKEIEEFIPRPHRQCKHCRQIDYEYLNYNGEPIMGECVYCKNRFLLNEKINCKEFRY